ncbi:MAG: RrF2 family transcriptional regulator [Planctomycetota bacterium]
MTLTKRCEYALRALIDIELAQRAGRPVLSATELGAHQRIPTAFLEQILLQLREAGFIESRRGKSGGYTFAKDPTNITIGDVVRVIDGPLAPIRCVSKTAYEPCSCPSEEHCGLHMVMQDVRNAISEILDRHTVADVAERAIKSHKKARVTLPFST